MLKNYYTYKNYYSNFRYKVFGVIIYKLVIKIPSIYKLGKNMSVRVHKLQIVCKNYSRLRLLKKCYVKKENYYVYKNYYPSRRYKMKNVHCIQQLVTEQKKPLKVIIYKLVKYLKSYKLATNPSTRAHRLQIICKNDFKF